MLTAEEYKKLNKQKEEPTFKIVLKGIKNAQKRQERIEKQIRESL